MKSQVIDMLEYRVREDYSALCQNITDCILKLKQLPEFVVMFQEYYKISAELPQKSDDPTSDDLPTVIQQDYLTTLIQQAEGFLVDCKIDEFATITCYRKIISGESRRLAVIEFTLSLNGVMLKDLIVSGYIPEDVSSSLFTMLLNGDFFLS